MKNMLFISFTGLLTNLKNRKITLSMVRDGLVFIKGLYDILDYSDEEFDEHYNYWGVEKETIEELKKILRHKMLEPTAISVFWGDDLEISKSIEQLNHLLITHDFNKIEFSDKHEMRNFIHSHPHAKDVIEDVNPELTVIWTGIY